MRLVLQKWQLHLTVLWFVLMWVGFLRTASGHTLCSYQINMSRTYLDSASWFLFTQCKHGQKLCFQKPYATHCELQPKETFTAHNVISEKRWAISRWCFCKSRHKWSLFSSKTRSHRGTSLSSAWNNRQRLWLRTCAAFKVYLLNIVFPECSQKAKRA